MDQDRYSKYVTPLGETDPGQLRLFWDRYLASADLENPPPMPLAGAFGDTVELAEELIALILIGQKRATATALADYEAENEPIAEIGDLYIATDGQMRPRAVLEITDVQSGPLSSVDDQFAWDEGEGDRSRDTWLADHTWAFTRTYARLGQEFHPDIPVVFERFTVIYSEA